MSNWSQFFFFLLLIVLRKQKEGGSFWNGHDLIDRRFRDHSPHFIGLVFLGLKLPAIIIWKREREIAGVSKRGVAGSSHLFEDENMKKELSFGKGFDFFWLLMDGLRVLFPAAAPPPPPFCAPAIAAPPFPPPLPASKPRGPPTTPEEHGSCW